MKPGAVRRGRPLKFGRPAQLVTLTLPDDVIKWLGTVDRDLAWAIVKLHERGQRPAKRRRPEVADLVQLPGQRALILVDPAPFRNIPGVSVIPLADGRGFLALESNRGVADLELAVIDRLDHASIGADERQALTNLRLQLKQWRQEGIEFESRSIILARGLGSAAKRATRLAPVGSSQRRPDVA